MGLDIYFKRRRNSNAATENSLAKFYGSFEETDTAEKVRGLAKQFGVEDKVDVSEHEYTDGNGNKTVYVTAYRNDTEEAAYFRKHNHLLPYFGYGENCSNLPISRNQLEQFIEDAKEVLSHEGKDDFQQVAAELIPTESGFFFGSVEYGEWYCSELRENIEAFQGILDNFDFNTDILYMHCWW